ncbi:MAG TPA: PilX N-terminal domain-containing pilus assembly protein [Gammaproteobacteria bacterium]|nr:PilX N-terminal domain-containing pilus assembly protein [Gammaproteobacteria bacterium]
MNVADHPLLQVRRAERGAVLVISLLMLLVLTLIGLAATRSTTLEERMAGNQRDQQLAFEEAEMALRDGESALQNAAPGQFDNSGYLYNESATVTWGPGAAGTTVDSNTVVDWSGASTQTAQFSGSMAGLPSGATPPRYYIIESSQTGSVAGESLAADTPSTGGTIYYVYARGVGLSGENAVVLVSAYLRG